MSLIQCSCGGVELWVNTPQAGYIQHGECVMCHKTVLVSGVNQLGYDSEVERLKAELAAAREILRGCWIQCDTFKKPVMCWDMYHALEKWAADQKEGQ
jgi:hypothetical protein